MTHNDDWAGLQIILRQGEKHRWQIDRGDVDDNRVALGGPEVGGLERAGGNRHAAGIGQRFEAGGVTGDRRSAVGVVHKHDGERSSGIAKRRSKNGKQETNTATPKPKERE